MIYTTPGKGILGVSGETFGLPTKVLISYHCLRQRKRFLPNFPSSLIVSRVVLEDAFDIERQFHTVTVGIIVFRSEDLSNKYYRTRPHKTGVHLPP